jgi:phosphoserine aminotransferase
MTNTMPGVRPAVPHFSSGPCAKRPGWTLQALKDAFLARSHRAKGGKAKLKRAIEDTRAVLEVPADYLIGIVPASDTGAMEMAMWTMLGARPVTMISWESFGEGWVTDVVKQLKLKDITHLKAPYGQLPDLTKADPKSDIVFTWNGTTSGVRATARMGQARCRDLLLAEGARWRSRARHAHPLAARRGASRELQACVAAAEDLPHDQGREGQPRHLRG